MIVRTVQSPRDILAVTNILRTCGKDMAKKYDLHHWDNPWIKTLLIVMICLIKNKVYVVKAKKIVATYQTKITEDNLYFEKLAVKPEESGKGIGSFCLKQIENEGRKIGCMKVRADVYSKSQHAIQFYQKHGYRRTGEN